MKRFADLFDLTQLPQYQKTIIIAKKLLDPSIDQAIRNAIVTYLNKVGYPSIMDLSEWYDTQRIELFRVLYHMSRSQVSEKVLAAYAWELVEFDYATVEEDTEIGPMIEYYASLAHSHSDISES